jgi:hypothetical protein
MLEEKMGRMMVRAMKAALGAGCRLRRSAGRPEERQKSDSGFSRARKRAGKNSRRSGLAQVLDDL